jgi:molybdopterin-guanine dinucleotide biosynthesis protein A
LQPLFAEILISANEPAPFEPFGLTIVPDAVQGRGPLGGIAAALAHTAKPFLFAVGADMPHIHTAAVDLVVGRRAADIDVVVPYVNGLPEPLFALYSQRCLDVVRRRLDAGCNKLSGLLDDDSIAISAVDEDELRAIDGSLRALTNINSPADLP